MWGTPGGGGGCGLVRFLYPYAYMRDFSCRLGSGVVAVDVLPGSGSVTVCVG